MCPSINFAGSLTLPLLHLFSATCSNHALVFSRIWAASGLCFDAHGVKESLSHKNRSRLCTSGDCILNMVSGLREAPAETVRCVFQGCRKDVPLWRVAAAAAAAVGTEWHNLCSHGQNSQRTEHVCTQCSVDVPNINHRTGIYFNFFCFEFKIWPISENFSTYLGYLKKWEVRMPCVETSSFSLCSSDRASWISK